MISFKDHNTIRGITLNFKLDLKILATSFIHDPVVISNSI
jgi:hypothetical protein